MFSLYQNLSLAQLFETYSRIAFCDVPDRLGFGITIILAWRQMKKSFYPKAFYPLTESCSLGYVTIKCYKNIRYSSNL